MLSRLPRSSLLLLCCLALPTVARAQTLVSLVPDAFDPQPCGGTGCWTNYLRVTDLDGDGDLDVVMANYSDFFQGNDSPEPLAIYKNNGSGVFTNVSTSTVGDYIGNLRQIAIGDVDGDGRQDIYGADGAGQAPVLFMQQADGSFVDEAGPRLPAGTNPKSAATRFADVDNDGDLDLFVADGYATATPPVGHLYINDGSGVFSEKANAIPTEFGGRDIDDVEFFDVDRDFDLDLFVNSHQVIAGALWLNDGTGTFTAGGTVPPVVSSFNHYDASVCDVDGDGDLDMWIDNIAATIQEMLLINDGAGNFSDETAARVTGNISADDNGVICVDVDDDGDFDGVVVSLSGPERLLENDGAGNFTLVADAFPPPGDCSLWGEFGDLNGDARLDLVTGQGECSSSNELYLGSMEMPVDARAPRLIAVEELEQVAAGETPVIRFAVSDRSVTDEGPRLARAFVLLDPTGAATEVEAQWMGGDLYRALLPAAEGLVEYQVCAVDLHDNQGCSDTASYTVPASDADAGPGGADAGVDGADAGGDEPSDGDSGCGCRSSDSSGGLSGLFVLALAWLGLRRRRAHAR